MSINSKAKGKKGELYVVNQFKQYGYKCRRTSQYCGKTGKADDIEGIDYIHAEVKFVEKLNLDNAMNQAIRDSLKSDREAMPTVFHKKNYQDLLVSMRFKDWIQLYNSYYSDRKISEKLRKTLEEK